MKSGIIKVEVSVISRSRIISQKPNLKIVLLYIVLKKLTTNALSHRTQISRLVNNRRLRCFPELTVGF